MIAPSFSIVIPTHARPSSLAKALDSIARVDWPTNDFEVIVVDDGSPDDYSAVVKQFEGRIDVHWRAQHQQGPAAARNHGAREAQGRFLVFTDDDCEPDPGWLAAFHRALSNDPLSLVGGRVRNALPDNPYSEAAQQLTEFIYGYQIGRADSHTFFTSNNIALSAIEFRRVEGFDAAFPRPAGEDREFCRRWVQSGRRLRHEPEAVVRHSHALTFRSFWRQNFNYGRGAEQFHAGAKRDSTMPEPASFYLRLVASGFAGGFRPRYWQRAALLVLSQAAVGAGFFWEWVGRLRSNRVAASDAADTTE